MESFVAPTKKNNNILGAVLGTTGGFIEGLLGRVGAVLESLGAVLELSWGVLEPSWGVLRRRIGASWAILGRRGVVLGPFWVFWKRRYQNCRHTKNAKQNTNISLSWAS